MKIVRIPVLQDNYTYLVHEESAKVTAVVDPAVARPVLEKLDELGWKLDVILATHHHHDHVGGNLELKRATRCRVAGPRGECDRIPGIDVELAATESFTLGGTAATIFETPGHTGGHVSLWFREAGHLFCGDVIFGMGCGRLFEGSPAEMWQSLQTLAKLPPETLVHCGHEYTESNGRFALSVEPANTALLKRCRRVKELRAAGEATVPFTLREELETNPFLRPQSEEIRATLGLPSAGDGEVFAALRQRKDRF